MKIRILQDKNKLYCTQVRSNNTGEWRSFASHLLTKWGAKREIKKYMRNLEYPKVIVEFELKEEI